MSSCNKKLNDWNILTTASCNFCPNIDDLTHFFINCNNVKLFWQDFYNWFNRCNNTQFCLPNDKTILFGYPILDDLHFILNYCSLYAKYFINTQRLYGNNVMHIHDFLNKLKLNTQIEKLCTHKKQRLFTSLKYLFYYHIQPHVYQ